MKRFQLLRHAKSEHLYGVDDHDRSLADRGKKDINRIGKWAASKLTPPDVIHCSSSQRTRETIDLFLNSAGWNVDVIYSEDLYLPYYRDVITYVRETISEDSVMIVGHNPFCTNLYNTLSINFLDNMPTSGFAEFEVTDEWIEFAANKYKNTAFCIPKNLSDAR